MQEGQETQKPAAKGEPTKESTPNVDARVAELTKEAAAHRVARNNAIRQAHAYKTILKAHGIDLGSVTEERLNAIPISDGKADGVFDYTPPKVAAPKKDDPPKKEGQPALTKESLATMPHDEINKRWGEVQAVLQAG